MSKVWSDHETLKDALHYIILLYDRSLCIPTSLNWQKLMALIGNAYPKNTPKYCIEDVIDFLDNLYDVVFMTYEASVTAYGIPLPSHLNLYLRGHGADDKCPTTLTGSKIAFVGTGRTNS
jgi:hypothetical protein